MLAYFCIQKSYTNTEEECETHRDGEINERAHWKVNFPWKLYFLLLHPSGERYPPVSHDPLSQVLRIGKRRKGLKLFTAGYVCIRDMTPCKQTPSDKLHNHSTYLCAYPFFTSEEDFPDRLLSLYEADQSRLVCVRFSWTVSIPQADSDVMWWDEMLSSPLLQLSQMRLSLCRATATPPLAHVIA